MFTIRAIRRTTLLFLFPSLSSLGHPVAAQDPGHVFDPAHDHEAKLEWKGDPYLLPTDPVFGAPLGAIEKQVIVEHEGRELRFASKANADAFDADPQKYLRPVDEQLVRQQLPFYPTDTCVVSGTKLGDLGAPFDYIYRNRLIRLSSKDGVQTFLQDPAKYVKKLDREVIAKQLPVYPLEVCVVSGEELGAMADPVDLVFGNRLVRFCCKDCQKGFRKDPLRYLDKPDLGHREHEGARESGG